MRWLSEAWGVWPLSPGMRVLMPNRQVPLACLSQICFQPIPCAWVHVALQWPRSKHWLEWNVKEGKKSSKHVFNWANSCAWLMGAPSMGTGRENRVAQLGGNVRLAPLAECRVAQWQSLVPVQVDTTLLDLRHPLTSPSTSPITPS